MSKRRIRVVSAAIVRDGRYLISQRSAKAVLPLLWEFPGGRVEERESDAAALSRELKHRLGLEPRVRELISSVEREYPDYIVDLHLYRCELGSKEPQALNVTSFAWVSSKEFDKYEFTPADQRSMDALLFGVP